MTQKRTPAGVSTGGQFAVDAKAEPAAGLIDTSAISATASALTSRNARYDLIAELHEAIAVYSAKALAGRARSAFPSAKRLAFTEDEHLGQVDLVSLLDENGTVLASKHSPWNSTERQSFDNWSKEDNEESSSMLAYDLGDRGENLAAISKESDQWGCAFELDVDDVLALEASV